LNPIKTENLIDLQLWCRDFYRTTKYPSDEMRRFAIGFYQLYQGIDWGNSASADESYAAAAIHFLVIGEMLNLDIETYAPTELRVLVYSRSTSLYMSLLRNLSKAQAMLVYMTNDENVVNRKSRYNPDTLASCLGEAVRLCFRLIRPLDRAKAIETATQIMTGVL